MADQPGLDEPQRPGGEAPLLGRGRHRLPPQQVRVREGEQRLDPAPAAAGPAAHTAQVTNRSSNKPFEV